MSARVKTLLPLVTLFALALSSRDATGVGLLADSATQAELRIAVAIGPSRTTTWSELRLRDSEPGPLALVVPAPLGASLDLSNEAWFEALEKASAPRVVSPKDAPATCPGKPYAEDRIDVVGDLGSDPAAHPLEIQLLDGPAAVAEWAQKNGLPIAPEQKGALAALAPMRFLVVRISSPGGTLVTPTVRVSAPGAKPILPLVLAQADGEPLLVTAFAIAEGRAALLPGEAKAIAEGSLQFDVATGHSNYAKLRAEAIDQPDDYVLDSASHEAWANAAALDPHALSGGVVQDYFARAASHLGAGVDVAGCTAAASPLFSGAKKVAASCPRAALGTVGGAGGCDEVVAPGQIDPDAFRCGAELDDLAVALSELAPSKAWLSRMSLSIPAGASGVSVTAALAPGETVSPVRRAHGIDSSGCGSSHHVTPGSGGGSAVGGAATSVSIPVYAVREGCSSKDVALTGMRESTAVDPPNYYYYREDGCGRQDGNGYTAGYDHALGSSSSGSSSSDASPSDGSSQGVPDSLKSDSCDGSSSGSGSGSSSSDSCDGSSSDPSSGSGDDCSGDSAGSSNDSCSGDTGSSSGGDACNGSSSGESCNGSSGGGESCSGGGSAPSDCSIHGARRLPRPRLSALVVLSLFALVPWRRSRRPKQPKRHLRERGN